MNIGIELGKTYYCDICGDKIVAGAKGTTYSGWEFILDFDTERIISIKCGKCRQKALDVMRNCSTEVVE